MSFFEALGKFHLMNIFMPCPSVCQIQDLRQSTKCGFSKKAFRRQYFFLFTYVLLTCYHHLRAKLGMYIALCIFLNFWQVCSSIQPFVFYITGTLPGRTAMAESTGTPISVPALPMFTLTENRAGFYIRVRTGSWALERPPGPRASQTHQNSMEVILNLIVIVIVQLNQYETAPNYFNLNQNLTWIYLFFTSSCMLWSGILLP